MMTGESPTGLDTTPHDWTPDQRRMFRTEPDNAIRFTVAFGLER
jgi:hypothetical protein